MKSWLKDQLASIFHLGQRAGFDILPRHFYSEIPDFRKLRKSDQWRQPFSMRSIRGAALDSQVEFVRSVMADAARERLKVIHAEACRENGASGFGPMEAQVLYAFIKHFKPARIIQVGAGVATAICLAAAKDGGYQPTITCIDPFPSDYLRKANVRLLAQPVETVSTDFVSELTAGDLFFVDSTHTLGPSGECTRLICEVLPRLNAGVFVHFHDIFFPFDFSPRVMGQVFFWHETALLLAFLSCNPTFEIKASLAMLHHDRPADLQHLFVDYHPQPMDRGLAAGAGDYPSSIYLRTLASANSTSA